MDKIIKPVSDGHISSPFGVKRKIRGFWNIHNGIDIGSPRADKAEILCPIASEVCACGYSSSFGNRIWLRILEGEYKDMYLVLAHLSKINVFQKGTKLEVGTIIGLMGNTGLSEGIHLHLELRTKPDSTGKSINPELFSNCYL